MNELEPIDPKNPNAKPHEMYVSVDRKLIPVLKYLEDFKWEVSLYPYEKTLRENGLKCIEKQVTADKDLRKYMEQIQDTKSRLNALTKKQSSNLANTDLAELVYEDKNNLKED